MDNIRNFSIIAHIDHGKSTLADRFLEITGLIKPGESVQQILDSMDVEREHGITVKAHHVRLYYKAEDGNEYILNLIDTPGHVDFSYEVSRSMLACEGALLLVDATQGVEAQTISNLYLAIDNDLEIIPVINKIDLPGAAIEEVKQEIMELLGCDEEEIILASAKENIGTKEILERIVKEIPPPKGRKEDKLKALVFDSVYDNYRGALAYVRVFDGMVKKGDKIKFLSNNHVCEVLELGHFRLRRDPADYLQAGDVGYIIGGIKNLRDIKVGDTITHEKNEVDPIAGFQDVKPMVFCGFFPSDGEDVEKLGEALKKLQLNDAALTIEHENSPALGFGYRCGFLGLLHMSIVQERLEKEYEVSLVATMPSVRYRVVLRKGETIEIDNPAQMPDEKDIERIEEPYIEAEIVTPPDYVGNVLKLCEERRGIQKKLEYITSNRVEIVYELPLSEVVFDFYDRLKSVSRGYASFDYTLLDYRESDLVKLNILVNGQMVDALSVIVHSDKAYHIAQKLTSKLKELIPRQLFEVAIQAAIGRRVIARTTVKALRKNVLAKCYGGDVTRKKKLLEKQKEGKKRMKQIGKVSIPQEAFLAALKINKEDK